jgi:outer membrane protein assembly factor BamD (BamD/ComL family)
MLRTASLAALLFGAAPLVAQVSPAPSRPDSTSPAPAAGLAATDSTSTRRDSVIVPRADQARGVDAEIRVALFQLLDEQYVPALSRLQWLAASPVALTGASAGGVLRGREDMLFLLAQTYYRLGMDSAFRMAATPLVTGANSARFGRLLRSQLLLDAYRRGDYAGAISLAEGVDVADRGLGALVAGLAAYQMGNLPAANAHFAAAQSSGAPYGQYAQYMQALAMLRADTTKRAEALTALQSLTSSATGKLQDQARLTAAELAYESERYDDAARLAGEVSPTSGLAAQAQLTRAWALYKAKDVAGAGQAFDQYATRYPQLPERDEARLMYGQALLQLGRTQDAANVFRTVADSAASESRLLQTKARTAMTDAARALVQARAAGLLFIADPANGKTVALDDQAGSERQVLAAAFGDSVGPSMPAVSAAEIISLDDVSSRVDAVAPASDLRRVVFAPASATKNPEQFGRTSQALYAADVSVVLAQYEVAEQMAAQQRQIVMLRQLQQRVASEAQAFAVLAARLTAARDSLARLAVRLDAAGTRIQQMFSAQVNTTRMLANENRAAIDSVKTTLGGAQGALEYGLLDTEAQTATAYVQLADIIERGIPGAVAHHPVFALRDSVSARATRVGTLLADAQNRAASTQSLLAAEIARLEGSDTDRLRAMRASLAAAESRRNAAESAVVAVVDAELRARATEMIAGLKRDTEAAEFGSASASFFQAIDAGQPSTTTGTSSSAAAQPTPTPNAAPDARATPQSQRK